MRNRATTDQPDLIDRGLRAMAIGRVALGIGALAAPGPMARALGVRDSGDLTYMTRIFGARAIALGVSYLLGGDDERVRLRRICLGVDTTDTLHGIDHLVRGDVPRPAMAALVALTGTYAAIGAARLVTDLRSG